MKNRHEIIPENFRGNVMIVKEGATLVAEACGFADLPNKVPNKLDTRFATASAGKLFVAVGILKLIEDGKLELSSTLAEVVKMNWRQIDSSVTVFELLTHTSGVPDYFDEQVMEEYEELWQDYPNYKIRHNADLLPLFIDKPMMYPRGERFQYNNTGFVLLAMMIEEVTGKAFDVYLEEVVFKPSGMTRTGYYELDRLPAGCAANYIYDEAQDDYRTNIFSVDVKGTGAGGAFTTVGDIVLFWQNLLGGKLIKQELVQEMLTVQASDAEDSYGYGIWIHEDGEITLPYFQGLDPGVSFISEYSAENQMITVIISNYCDNVWQMMRDVREKLYR